MCIRGPPIFLRCQAENWRAANAHFNDDVDADGWRLARHPCADRWRSCCRAGLIMELFLCICNAGRVRVVWNLTNVWYGRSAFLKTNRNKRNTKLNYKTSVEHFLSTAFAFRVSHVPVAALGGHSFDARAPFVANEFPCAAQPNHNHIKMLRENVIVIGLFFAMACCILSYRTVAYRSILYSIVLFRTVPYCTVM